MNVFSTLSRFATRATENYLTEAFVYLLRMVVASDEPSSYIFLNNLLGISPQPSPPTPARLVFATQVSHQSGILDIEVSLENQLRAFIEVKHDSPLGPGQLASYRSILDAFPEPRRALVLLTRSRASAAETTLAPDKYHHVCWYDVHKWLGQILTEDAVVLHLIADFRSFLEEKQMSLNKVAWQYEDGIRALIDLTTMLEAAVLVAFDKAKVQRTGGWGWRGFVVDNKYFLGIRHDNPMILTFEDNKGTNPTFVERLDLSSAHFFSLHSQEQFEALTVFLRSVREKAGTHPESA